LTISSEFHLESMETVHLESTLNSPWILDGMVHGWNDPWIPWIPDGRVHGFHLEWSIWNIPGSVKYCLDRLYVLADEED
jgi:hypothetical protein